MKQVNKYIIIIATAIVALLNIIILDAVEIKMCKTFSIYRLFTMNSTVCTNISKAVGILEKMLTTVVIALCSTVFQEAIAFYSLSPSRNISEITINFLLDFEYLLFLPY